jgi:cyclase
MKPASNPFAPRTYGELHRVTERVYIYRNITNSSFVVGDRGVAVVDTQVNRPTAERLLQSIRSVTDKPVTHVINTHYHWDHTNGNSIFKKLGATIISSELTKRFMVERAPRQKEFLAGRGFELGEDPYLPEATFDGERELDLGGVPARLFFAGRAESDDATAVYLPSERVLMAGDTVMTGSFPIFGQPVWDEGLQNDEWILTLERLTALDPAHVIPGHGPLAAREDIDKLVRIERFFLDEVGRLVERGLSAEEALGDLEPRLPEWITGIPVVWGTPRYAILRVWRGLTRRPGDPEPGWQRFKPSAIPSAPRERLGAAASGTLEELFEMAAQAGEGGDAGLCLSVLKKACERFPDSDEAHVRYAEALIRESRAVDSVLEKGDFFDAARRAWDVVLARRPFHTAALLGKGRYLTMMAFRGGEDPSPGMALLEKVLEQRPGGRLEAEAHFYLGLGYRRLGRESAAREKFELALAADPAFPPPRLAAMAS